MADAITIQALQDARLDAKSLEKFINGSEDETILTRLNADYPTLQKALKELFESGGIAGRFKTLTLLQASSLTDGKYALVTEDLDENNGLYIKESGTWVKSKYNPTVLASKQAIALLERWQKGERFEVVNSSDYHLTTGVIAADQPTYSIPYGSNEQRQNMRIDVSGYKKLSTIGARSNAVGWRWVITDADKNRLYVEDKWGDVEIVLPEGAVYAWRTYQVGDYSSFENQDMQVILHSTDVGLDSVTKNVELLTPLLQNKRQVKPTYTDGRLMRLDFIEAQGNLVFLDGGGYSYLKVDVSKAYKLKATGSINSSSWLWVFANADGSRAVVSDKYGDQEVSVPDWAVYAYRSSRSGGSNSIEPESMTVTLYTRPDAMLLSVDAINNIELKVADLSNPMWDKLKTCFENSQALKISDFTGASQHEQIENAIKFIRMRGWGVLDMESGVWLRDSAVLLPSNCWLYLNEATIKLKSGVFDNVIRNDGIVPSSNPYNSADELKENRNIRVFGKSVDTAKVSGSDTSYTAPHPVNGGDPVAWEGDWYGWRTVSILLANVKNYELDNFAMDKTKCWAISQEHGCENFKVHDIKFTTYVKNGDGVDCRMGCKNGEIYNITGRTSDDTVALSALMRSISQYPRDQYVYPMQIGGYSDRGLGTGIENVHIYNIKANGDHNGVRLLASGGAVVKHIGIDNVEDVGDWYGGSVVYISSGYGAVAEMGDMTNITINKIKSNQTRRAVTLANNLQDVYVNNVRQAFKTGDIVYDTSTKDNVIISNIEMA